MHRRLSADEYVAWSLMICSRAFCSDSKHALRSCSVVLPPIKLTIARAAARQVSSMSICGMSARVLSVKPHIMATTAAAITTAFDIVELGIVLAEIPSSTEVETILIMRGLRRAPPAKAKAKFILATDGIDFEAEDITSGETVACAYQDFPDHFGFFLPLAGITTVKQVRESSFDIRATSRLNRLYVELLKDNPEWGTADRRHDMNHFMARLIFCFFAEDTDIFSGTGLFTATIERMSARDSTNTHEVIGELFRAMNTKGSDRASARIPRWADDFPYVN